MTGNRASATSATRHWLGAVRFRVMECDLWMRGLLGSRTAQMEQEFRRLQALRSEEATTTILGRPLRLAHAAAFEPMYREIFEREIFKFDTDVPSPRIIDCGAHVGMASIYLGLRYQKARITAFEADPRVAAIAKTNLKSFGLHAVEVIAAAVTDREGVATFSATGDLAGRIPAPHDAPDAKAIVVPAVRLASYLEEPIDFLKIDIEGAEHAVLPSIADQLRNVRRMFVEYHGFAAESQDLHEFLGILRRSGFRCYITNASDFRRSPLQDATTFHGMDLQLNIFCVRDAAAF